MKNNWCIKYIAFDLTKNIAIEIVLIFLQVITNLTQALERQKERIELMRKFTLWRIQHVKAKQEVCGQNKNGMKMEPLNSKGSELLQFLLQFEEMTVSILMCLTMSNNSLKTSILKRMLLSEYSLGWGKKIKPILVLYFSNYCDQLTTNPHKLQDLLFQVGAKGISV